MMKYRAIKEAAIVFCFTALKMQLQLSQQNVVIRLFSATAL